MNDLKCNCGYGGFHEPLNPRCQKNQPMTTSDPYVPTTEEVRSDWSQRASFNGGGVHDRLLAEAFDRWLAGVRADQAEKGEWESAKWHELTSDGEYGEPTGDTIKLTWDDGTVLIGRLTVPSQGSGHHQICRMLTQFGGDTHVFPHGSTLFRRAVALTPTTEETEVKPPKPFREAAFDRSTSPGAGYVWCDDCGHWYPPESVHARSRKEQADDH